MVYITNKTKNTTAAISFQSTTKNITLEHGDYNFKAVGWDGVEALHGNFLCGESNANLKDPKATVEISINSNNCKNDAFVPATFRATAGIATLSLTSCQNISSVSGFGSTCDDSQRGLIESYRVRLVSYESKSAINSDVGLNSPCIAARSAPNGTLSTDIRLPYGNSEGIYATAVETFLDGNCSTGKVRHYFPWGLAYPSSDAISVVHSNGYTVNLFGQRGSQALVLNSITISSSNANPAFAKSGDSVYLNITTNRPATFSATINSVPATVTGSGNTYTVTRVLTSSEPAGVISFEITAEGNAYSAITTGSGVDYYPPITAPNITLIDPVISPSYDNTPTFQVSNLATNANFSLYSDPTCSMSIQSGTYTGSTSIITSSPLVQGNHTIYVKQTDPAGNISSCSSPVNYTYQPVQITGVSATSSNMTNNSFAKMGDTIIINFTSNYTSLPLTAMLNGNNATITPQGGTIYQISYTVAGGIPEGVLNLVVQHLGLPVHNQATTILIDYTAPVQPTITRNSPTADAAHDKQLYIQASNLEIGGQVKIYYDASCSTLATQLPISTTSHILTVSGLGVQQYQFYSRQYDQAGNGSPCTSTSVAYRVKAPFISKWQTTSANETINLPLPTGNIYNFKVDWGDGSAAETFTGNVASHTYATAGNYTMTIIGVMEAWSFNGGGSKDKIKEVTDFGEMGWKNLYGAFKGCLNLTVFNGGVYNQVTNMGSMFSEAPQVNPNTMNWNTSSVTNMSSLFYNATSATPDTLNWDTSNVTLMESMFDGATAANPNTMNWNTSQVTFMRYMFRNATSANPNTATWNTGNVTNMGGMFQGAVIANPDTSNWNTSNVIEMHNMFNGATIANPDTSNWDTANVVSMDSMFKYATVANPDTSNWDTSNVTMMTYMFYGATSANPDTSSWDFGQVDNVIDMFYQSDIDVTNWSNFLVRAALTGQSGVGITLEAPTVYNPAIFDSNAQVALSNRGWTVNNNFPQ